MTAEVRQGTGKGVARKLRAAGKVPGVVYGAGVEARPIAVDARSLSHAFATEAGLNVLIDLQVDGTTYLTLARELQRDPLRGTIVHVDFLKVDRDKAIEVEVPVHIVGDSHGVREGGVVEHHLWSLRVSCKPGDVPERIDADITPLGLHEHLRVGDLPPLAGVEILTDASEAIVSVVTPQVLKVEAELEQPEVAAEAVPPAEGEAAPPAAPAPGGGEGS